MNKQFVINLIENKKKYNALKAWIQVIGSNGDAYTAYLGKKKIFLMMLPTYGNIGDQAITGGAIKFLEKKFPDYTLIMIDLTDTCKKIRSVKKVIEKNDIVFLQGGGNLGNLYPFIENYRRFIIKNLSTSNIVSLPITATFTKNREGKNALKKSKKIYSKCENLTIIAREKYSYDYLRKMQLGSKVLLSPDIAFELDNNEFKKKRNRNGILICMRHDAESIYTNTIDDIVLSIMNEYDNARIIDTTVTRNITNKTRHAEIISLMREFSEARLIVTDRMHAMVLCALTGTPCIVTRALDEKIMGTYEWISNLKNIYLVDEFESINVCDLIHNILKEGCESDFPNFEIEFNRVYKELKF